MGTISLILRRIIRHIMDMYGCRINAESQDVSQCCLARRSKASYSLNVAIIEAGRGDSPGPKPNGVREIVELIRGAREFLV